MIAAWFRLRRALLEKYAPSVFTRQVGWAAIAVAVLVFANQVPLTMLDAIAMPGALVALCLIPSGLHLDPVVRPRQALVALAALAIPVVQDVHASQTWWPMSSLGPWGAVALVQLLALVMLLPLLARFPQGLPAGWMRSGVRFSVSATTPYSLVFGLIVVQDTGWGVWTVPWVVCLAVIARMWRAEWSVRSSHERRVTRIENAVLRAAILVAAGVLASPLATLYDYEPYDGPGGDEGSEMSQRFGPEFGPELDTSTRGSLSDRKVLTVRADRPDYWRAQTYSNWDGRRWSAESKPTMTAETTVGIRSQWRSTLVQRVTILGSTGTLLFGANEVVDVSGIETSTRTSDIVRAKRPLGPGDSYTVVSRSFDAMANADLLRAVSRVTLPLPDEVEKLATELPTTSRVREAARSVTANEVDDFGRVTTLVGWIRSRASYDIESPVPEPGEDAVDRFLFVDREGFCEQFASALVVMARALGIPARLAVGFIPGERDGNEWLSRERDAHAWAEIWFPSVGWVRFDPTPPSPATEPLNWKSLLIAVAVSAGVAAAAGLVILAARRWRRTDEFAASNAEGLSGLIERFQTLGSDQIGPRRPSETLGEYGRRVDELVGDSRPSDVAIVLSLAAYNVPFPESAPEHTEEAIQAIEGVIATLERPRASGRSTDSE